MPGGDPVTSARRPQRAHVRRLVSVCCSSYGTGGGRGRTAAPITPGPAPPPIQTPPHLTLRRGELRGADLEDEPIGQGAHRKGLAAVRLSSLYPPCVVGIQSIQHGQIRGRVMTDRAADVTDERLADLHEPRAHPQPDHRLVRRHRVSLYTCAICRASTSGIFAIIAEAALRAGLPLPCSRPGEIVPLAFMSA